MSKSSEKRDEKMDMREFKRRAGEGGVARSRARLHITPSARYLGHYGEVRRFGLIHVAVAAASFLLGVFLSEDVTELGGAVWGMIASLVKG
jgi:hypothetical protein